MRVGHGFDSHRFLPGRPLILAGVHVPSELGLEGHSDADAISHAVIDAALGAAGLGDIGHHFPPTDETWRDADSIALLTRVVDLLASDNLQIVNVDVTVVTEQPRIGPYAKAMREKLAEVLALAARDVSIKGKSNEGMGWIGRGEGLAVFAVVLVNAVEDQGILFSRYRSDSGA